MCISKYLLLVGLLSAILIATMCKLFTTVVRYILKDYKAGQLNEWTEKLDALHERVTERAADHGYSQGKLLYPHSFFS